MLDYLIRMMILTLGLPIICVLLLRFLGILLQESFLESFGDGLGVWLLAPGVVVHELSHAIMSLIFGMRITDMKLFIPHSEDGTLGYVATAYNTASLKDRIGMVFVGIAPLIGNTTIIAVLYFLLFKEKAVIIWQSMKLLFKNDNAIYNILAQIFNVFSYNPMKLIFFLILMIILLSGFSLSQADLETSSHGLIEWILLLLILSVISYTIIPVRNILIAINISIVAVTFFLSVFLLLGKAVISFI